MANFRVCVIAFRAIMALAHMAALRGLLERTPCADATSLATSGGAAIALDEGAAREEEAAGGTSGRLPRFMTR